MIKKLRNQKKCGAKNRLGRNSIGWLDSWSVEMQEGNCRTLPTKALLRNR